MDLPDWIQKDQQEDNAEHYYCADDCFIWNKEAKSNLFVQHLRNQQKHCLIQRKADHKSAHNTDKGYIEILPGHCFGNMGFFHTQYIKDAEFLLPSFHQKTVGIKQENNRKERNNHAAHRHHRHHCAGTDHIFKTGIIG